MLMTVYVDHNFEKLVTDFLQFEKVNNMIKEVANTMILPPASQNGHEVINITVALQLAPLQTIRMSQGGIIYAITLFGDSFRMV